MILTQKINSVRPKPGPFASDKSDDTHGKPCQQEGDKGKRSGLKGAVLAKQER